MTTAVAPEPVLDRDPAFLAGVRRVAEVAALHAEQVDAAGRFPREALDRLRAEGALSALVPRELGGPGVPFAEVAQACRLLARSCASTAMVYAMHSIQVATLVRHAAPTPFWRDHLRELAVGQRLVASVTSEVGTGGDLGRSVAALEPLADGGFRFVKHAPTVSYGAYADDLLTTLRRHGGAEPGDQVLVLSRREQTELAATGAWDPLGMRGTCSPGFTVTARVPAQQVLATQFSHVSAATMVPVSHLLWAHLWLGIAEEAFDRARASTRAAARRGAAGPGGTRLSQLHSELAALRAAISETLAVYVGTASQVPAPLVPAPLVPAPLVPAPLVMVPRAREALPARPALLEQGPSPDAVPAPTLAAALRYNTLKITASEAAPRLCLQALTICGIGGYRNDSPYSVGRQLRDSLSAALMVSNDRLHETNAALLLVVKEH